MTFYTRDQMGIFRREKQRRYSHHEGVDRICDGMITKDVTMHYIHVDTCRINYLDKEEGDLTAAGITERANPYKQRQSSLPHSLKMSPLVARLSRVAKMDESMVFLLSYLQEGGLFKRK